MEIRSTPIAKQAAVAARRAQVAKLVLRGVTDQADMLDQLGLEHSKKNADKISKDIAWLRDDWVRRHCKDTDKERAELIIKAKRAVTSIWDAWEKSQKEPRRTKTTKNSGKVAEDAGPKLDKEDAVLPQYRSVEEQEEWLHGDPVYFGEWLKAMKLLADLCGIKDDKPQQVVEKNTVVLSQEVFQKIHERANELREGKGVPAVVVEGVLPAPKGESQ